MPHEDCLFIRLGDFFAARHGGDGGPEGGPEPAPGAGAARDAPPQHRPERREAAAVMPPRALRAAAARP